MWPVQQQKFIFFGIDVSTHSELLQLLLSVKQPFILTCVSPTNMHIIDVWVCLFSAIIVSFIIEKCKYLIRTGSIVSGPQNKTRARPIRIGIRASRNIILAHILAICMRWIEAFTINRFWCNYICIAHYKSYNVKASNRLLFSWMAHLYAMRLAMMIMICIRNEFKWLRKSKWAKEQTHSTAIALQPNDISLIASRERFGI